MRVAVVQMTSTDDLAANLAAASAFVAEAAAGGAALVALPENFAYLRREGQAIPCAQDLDGEIVTRLRALAREGSLWLLGGSFPERIPGAGQGRRRRGDALWRDRPLGLLRPALPGAVSRARGAGCALPRRAERLRPGDRPRSLGGAASRARHREPGLRAGARAVGPARPGPLQPRPLPHRGPLGHDPRPGAGPGVRGGGGVRSRPPGPHPGVPPLPEPPQADLAPRAHCLGGGGLPEAGERGLAGPSSRSSPRAMARVDPNPRNGRE